MKIQYWTTNEVVEFSPTEWENFGYGNTWAKKVMVIMPKYESVPLTQRRLWMYDIQRIKKGGRYLECSPEVVPTDQVKKEIAGKTVRVIHRFEVIGNVLNGSDVDVVWVRPD